MSWLTAGLTAGSALAGGLANRKSTSTTMPTLDPAYLGLRGDLIKRITDLMGDPAKGTEALRLGLMEGVNRRYQTMPGKLTTQLAKRGFAKSGQLGQGFKGLELARSGEIGDIDTKIADLILGRETQSYDLASRLLASGRGQTTTQSGNVFGGAIGGGLETLSTLTTLEKLLAGGGRAAGAGAGISSLPLSAGGTAALNPALHAGTEGLLAGGGAEAGAAGGGGILGGLAAASPYINAGAAIVGAAIPISGLVKWIGGKKVTHAEDLTVGAAGPRPDTYWALNGKVQGSDIPAWQYVTAQEFFDFYGRWPPGYSRLTP